MTNVINMLLNHSEFGNGQLKEFLGDSIVVRFAHGMETLPFPQAFENDLKPVNADDEKKIEEMKTRWEAFGVEKATQVERAEKRAAEERAAAPSGFKKFTVKITDTFKKIMPKKKEAAPAEEVKAEEVVEEAAPAEDNNETQE